jgi:hypothetical protein
MPGGHIRGTVIAVGCPRGSGPSRRGALHSQTTHHAAHVAFMNEIGNTPMRDIARFERDSLDELADSSRLELLWECLFRS